MNTIKEFLNDNQAWIIIAFVAGAAWIFFGYLLHKAGGVLKMQDERDKRNWNDQNWDDDE